ncbi:MAG TPA: Gfo/Idh/MocA family oxidoreductase [Candidatus Acidoferrales bacterium]|jgi:predicted dehydrogenase|nr:Gfo/Idh/MocA family oxidoreductase [Candidatus Acidoferrales bacterium]
MNALRIAIIGCGKIADQHIAAIRRIPGCEVVAACDREELMARQLAERFKVAGVFSDAQQMLKTVSPDVVHITTPPQGHFALAKQCLEAGSNVYLEKPFTVTAPEAEELIRFAKKSGLKITAGHNLQFTLEALEMRRLVQQGFIGGKPVHVESHYFYSLDDTAYVGPLLGNRNHWVRRLPGQLFHNVASHGIARLAEFLDDDLVQITASAHQSPQLSGLGGQEVLDELRVMIRDRTGTTAYFCFSTQLRPGLNGLRVCGSKNSLVLDATNGTVIRLENKSCKSYLTYFLPPLRLARQHFRNAWTNITDFMRGRLHQDSGMKELIEQFYQSIRNQTAPPIPYREILLTARIMDEVFAQIYPATEMSKVELRETASK